MHETLSYSGRVLRLRVLEATSEECSDTIGISTPNLGLEFAISGREREQGRCRGSREGAGGIKGEHRGSAIR